jgi:hypothetical protein
VDCPKFFPRSGKIPASFSSEERIFLQDDPHPTATQSQQFNFASRADIVTFDQVTEGADFQPPPQNTNGNVGQRRQIRAS